MGAKRATARNRPKRGKRYFTIDDANRALPYVGRIVKDVTECYKQVMAARQQLEMPRPEDAPDGLKAEFDDGMARLNGLVEELQEVGVELKDFERGLIDFPSLHDGREVYLCWHLGEDRIRAWHETDAGYAGRQDVALLEPIGAAAGDDGDQTDAGEGI